MERYFLMKSSNFLIDEAGSNLSQCQMHIYYKYAPDASKLVLLSYVYDCVYRYTYEDLVKWFLDTFVNRTHVNFLGYAH